MNTSSSSTTLEQVQLALQATHGITIFQRVLQDKPAQTMLRLLSALVAKEPNALAIATSYSRLFNELAERAQEEATPCLVDAWQAYLIGRIIDDSNVISRQVERVGVASMNDTMRQQAERDLRALQRLYLLNAYTVWQLTTSAVAPSLPILQEAWELWCNLAPVGVEDGNTARNMLARRADSSADWTNLVAPLLHHWARHGTGSFAHYHVFRWQGVDEGLQGIQYPDPVRLAQLIGYQREQNLLKANMERFLTGLPAHDMLLYGSPGTGKSSTVKALVNAYAEQGLRLIEVHKEYIRDLPRIVAQVRGHAPRFLLFIDDLSFEEHEVEYKVLKMLLEGTAEARPANVLICTTTNRHNIIREQFSDRGKPSEDVNWRDTMDEKLSLVHRFGLRVTFAAPDQERYLTIALGLARLRGITLPEETLRNRALQWERQRAGRSGRLARQFVDDLEAELHHL